MVVLNTPNVLHYGTEGVYHYKCLNRWVICEKCFDLDCDSCGVKFPRIVLQIVEREQKMEELCIKKDTQI